MSINDGLNRMNLDDLLLYGKEYNIEKCKRTEAINKLNKSIIKGFNKFMEEDFNFDVYDVINEINNKGISDNPLTDLLIDKMYVLFKDEDNLYVPDEIMNIINTKLSNKDYIIKLLRNLVDLYLRINLMMPVRFFIDNYINKYNLNIDISDIVNKDISIKDDKILYNLDNYEFYSLICNLTDKTIDYRILTMEELLDNEALEEYLYEDLSKVLLDKELLNEVNLLIKFDDNFIMTLEKSIKDKKTRNKVIDIYNEYKHDIRYTYYKGRNEKDISLDCLISLAPNKLLNIEEIIKLEKLILSKEDIIDFFNKAEERYIYELECIVNKEVSYENYNEDLVYLGLIYIGKVNNKYIYLMPKEIDKLYKELKELRNKNFKKFNYIYKYELDLCKYLDLNGIILKKDLAKLMNLSISDLESLCKHFRIQFDKTYVYDPIFDIEIKEKDSFYKGFKKYDKFKNINDVDISLTEELNMFLESHDIECDKCIIKDLYYFINFNNFNKNVYKDCLKEHGVIISNKELSDYYKELEEIIITCPLWYLNGYSKIELGLN